MSISFHHVTFAWDEALSPLFEDLTVYSAEGWTGIAGPNGSGKTTFLRMAAGYLKPQKGSVKSSGRIVFCEQRTDEIPARFPLMISDPDSISCVLRGKLNIGDDWANRWSTLSHGERKRAQIAAALWQQPDILLLDEPTNHIDIAGRELLADALLTFSGTGLLVSHDRDLLDLLCRQCIFLDPPRVISIPGNYTSAITEVRREELSLQRKRNNMQQNLERLVSESERRKAKASRADKKKSKRRLARGDSDGRAKIDLARMSGQDGRAGSLAVQLQNRIVHLQEEISGIGIKKGYKTHFWLKGSVSPRRFLFTLEAETIPLDVSRRLHIPELAMARDDRFAITGANGMGKSTLIRYILDHMNIPEERLVYIPQEIDLVQTRAIMSDLHGLSSEQLGKIMTVVSALGSRPERLLNNLDASPGELRKVLLALGVIRQPWLIVMDEPTNHLDLPAIECLEKALMDCPCGLLLISHDLRFLSGITGKRYHLQQKDSDITVSLEIF